MKKALLITGGTVAGVAAVLSYTPAQVTSASGSVSPSGGGATINSGAPSTPSTQVPTETTAPAPTDAGTPSSTPKSTATKKPASSTKTSSSGSSATASPATTPTQTPTSAPALTPTPAPTSTPVQKAAASNVTVTGRGYNAGGFGTVSVQITVTNGVVTAAKAVSYPNRDNRSAWISQQAIPWLVEQTLAAKDSANVAGVGGATYTSGAWINSLQSALTAAGL
ncbi:MAG: FMN-binding protein [Actinobacteria bacterium]|nr:FMN-binding protein [Actinomycetota bacterium]